MNRRIYIGSQLIELLDPDRNYQQLTEAQSVTYEILWALSHLGTSKNPHSVPAPLFLDLLRIRNPQVLTTRLMNLQKKGKIYITGAIAQVS